MMLRNSGGREKSLLFETLVSILGFVLENEMRVGCARMEKQVVVDKARAWLKSEFWRSWLASS